MTGYRECFEEAVTAAIAGLTVLTANTRSARAIYAAAEQRMRTTHAAWLTPDVLPYGAFVERLYSDAVIGGAVTVQALQREQELQLWRQIIERSPSGREMLMPESAAALACESFRTSVEYGIALDSPQMNASTDTRAFSAWAAEFQRQIAAHRWTCSALFTRELLPCLPAMSLPKQVFVFLAEVTPAQCKFLDALREAGVQLSAAPEHDEAGDCNPARYEFDGVADELRTAAQWARQQLESSPVARIGVIFFDLERNLTRVESAFGSVLHPEQLLGQKTPSAFEIASPRALAEYPVVRCALDLLSLFATPIEFHSFHSMLSSPYFAAEPEVVARFLARIRKHARRLVSVEDFARWTQKSRELPGLRTALEALPKHSAFSSEQAAAYWADISRRILEAFGWPGGVPLNSEEFQCTESWRELLVSISSLELLEWRTDFKGFVERLKRTAATQNFKPETLNAPVQIMSATEAEGSIFDALWIGSCSDDLWPDSPRLSPLIPIALLKEAGVALVGSPQAVAKSSRIASRLLQSAPSVSLSLARCTDDEREQRWSPCFAVFPLAGETIEMPLMPASRFKPANLDAIFDSSAPALQSGEAARGGTSLLQDQSNCPFRAFAIRRLLAREIEGPNDALAPTERGKVVDLALQLIWEQLKDSAGLQRHDRAAIVEAAVDEAMARELPLSNDEWTTRFRELERQRTIEVLTEWLNLESTRKPFHVVGHQLSVELSLGGLSLHGRLDRLDEIDDAHVVIDYKTGALNNVSSWQVPRPRMPQLPFYALAMQQQKFNLAGVSFAVVRKGESGFKGYSRGKDLLPCPDPSNRTFEGIAFDEYTGRWAVELERIAASFVQGDAAVDPKIPPEKAAPPASIAIWHRCAASANCRTTIRIVNRWERAMSSPTPSPVASDASLRLAVLDTTQSWMLQAPAGSGKTELLMQRFLACLATVDQPESVLAITFTRKAAAEMRSRILLTLQRAEKLSDGEISQCVPHKQQSLQLARAVLNTSIALGWNILENPARLQVRTLDSFCESVAQRAPFKGLLGGMAQVTEDAWPLYELAAQRVIDQLPLPGALGDAVAALLVHMDNDVRGVRNLLAAMLAQRDQWLHFLGRSDAFDAAQRQSLRERLEAALKLVVEEDLTLVRARLQSTLSSTQELECCGLMRYSANQLADVSGPSVPVIGSIAASADVVGISTAAAASLKSSPPLRDISAWPAATADHLSTWRAICDFLLTGSKPALRKAVDKRHGFPVNTLEQKTWKKLCVEFFADLAQLPDAEELCESLNRIRRLPDPHYTDPQWQLMQAVREILPLAAANLDVVFSEQATVDFAEYAQRALDAIGLEGDPTELGLQLGYRIRHILVDEFQDTNRVQVELLARLLRTWEADEQCSTFYVGDPMQSIYAFRQADVAIYQQARKEGIGGQPHNFNRLGQNFRSQRNLVEWFNRIFPLILREDSDLTNAVQYAEAQPSRPGLDGAAVHIKGFAHADRAGEAKHLAECIRRELAITTPAGEEPSTVAVLVRSRTHLPHLVEALRAAGIDFRAVKTDRLSDRPLVRDLESLRSALTDLADRTAWLSILRAPWCGFALADLLELCQGDEDSTIRELLHQRRATLSEQARVALARCLPVLEDALTRRGRGSLRALVESTWLRLGGPACLADQEQGIRDSEAYFALLDAQSSAGTVRDPENFAEKLHDLFAPADTRSGIRVEIMPIHQAKGLEWDVVFLPALERRSRQDDKSLLYWRLRRRREQEFLLLGPMEAPGRKASRSATIESYLRDIANDCSREELKRLFYVAATRARKRFYLSAAVPDGRQPDANSILRLLWDVPGMQQDFAPAGEPESGAKVEERPVPELLLRRLPATFVAPPMPEPLHWSSPQQKTSEEEHRFEWVGDLLPRIGVVAHAFLQRIALEEPSVWDAGRVASARPMISAALLRAGVMRGEMEQGIVRVLEALSRTLEDERGCWLLSPHEEHRCEFAVSAVIEGRLEHVRVDRTFIEDGVRWLIDYKITEQLGGDRRRFVQMQVEKYRSDMQRYARVLSAFDPRPVRCALYLPLLGEFCPVEIEHS